MVIVAGATLILRVIADYAASGSDSGEGVVACFGT
jgi:hypothetical protein